MGNNSDAIQCFNTVVEENPNDVLAYNHLGSIYAEEKDYDKAVASYQRGLKVDPNHPILHLNLAKALEKQGAGDLAEKEYESALRSKPGWLDAIDGYADLLIAKNHTRYASELLQQAIRLNPQNPSVHAKMGNVYDKQNDFDNAEYEYSESLKLDPKNSAVLSSLAGIYSRSGKDNEAIRTMEKYEKEAPGNPDMLRQYADILITADRLNAASQKIKEVWDMNPNDVQTLNLLGQYYICRGEEAKAEACFKKISALNPAYTEYYVDSAKRYTQTGKFTKAEKCAKKYLQINSPSAKASTIIAESYEGQNRFQEALNEFQILASEDDANLLYRKGIERITLKMDKGNTEKEEEDSNLIGDGEDEERKDSLEEQLSKASGEDGDEESGAIIPNIDFNNVDEKQMSESEMVKAKNKGYSFENLTNEDNSGGSPFTNRMDDDILASNIRDDDLTNLVPNQEDDTDEQLSYMASSGGEGMLGGPEEDLMDSNFMDEDIKDTRRNPPASTIDVSDGLDEPEPEPEYEPREEPKRREPRPEPKPAPSPEPMDYESDDTFESADSFESDNKASDKHDSSDDEGISADEFLSAEDFGSRPTNPFDEPKPKERVETPFGDDVPNIPIEEYKAPEEETPEDGLSALAEENEDYFFANESEEVPEVPEEEPEETNEDYVFANDVEAPAENAEEETVEEEEPGFEDESVEGLREEEVVTENVGDEEFDGSEETVENDIDSFISSDEPEYPDSDEEDVSFEDESEISSDAESETETESETVEENETEPDFDLDVESDESSTVSEESPVDEDEEVEIETEDEVEEEVLTPDLFIKLKNLSEYLPLEKRREFLKSRENMQLEYLIKKLGGSPGFLQTASSLWPDLNNDMDESAPVTREEIRGIFNYVKTLLPSLPDPNLADVLEEEMDKVLEKL